MRVLQDWEVTTLGMPLTQAREQMRKHLMEPTVAEQLKQCGQGKGSLSRRCKIVVGCLRSMAPDLFTLAAIQERTGLKHNWVGYILSGEIEDPSAHKLEILARDFGLTSGILLGSSEQLAGLVIAEMQTSLTTTPEGMTYLQRAVRLAELAMQEGVPVESLDHIWEFMSQLR